MSTLGRIASLHRELAWRLNRTAATESALEAAKRLPRWVYFIQAGSDAGPIKIGLAKDPAERLSDLQVAHFEELCLVAQLPGTATVERALHVKFSAYRIRGEWFRPELRLRQFIACVHKCVPLRGIQ